MADEDESYTCLLRSIAGTAIVLRIKSCGDEVEVPKLETLGKRIKWARTKAGLSQQELADQCGVSRVLITLCESDGVKRPKNIELMAQILDVSGGWLYFGDDEKNFLSKEGNELALKWESLTEEQKRVVKVLVYSIAGG